MDKMCNFLSSLKMTVISMVFLILSAISLFFKPDFPFEFAWVTVFISGIPIFYKGIKMLFKNKKMTAALLISIAMTAAILTNEIFDAGEVAFIMALGGILENLTIKKAKEGITKLLNLAPKTARRLLINDIEVNEEIIPAKDVKKDDIIRVLAGEDISCDGVIIMVGNPIKPSILKGESISG